KRRNRIRSASFADADDHTAFVWLLLFLAHASICGDNATSAGWKNLDCFAVELTGAGVACHRHSVPPRRAALREYIFCHAAAVCRAIDSAFVFQTTNNPSRSVGELSY